MNDTNAQPDWHAIAEKFDIWLPQLKPVGDAILAALEAKPGERILDVASGTGEPALTLAHQLADKAEIIGTDAAQGMVDVAMRKVREQGLEHLTFTCMPAEALTFPDAHFDRILSRFGVMLFANPVQGLREMHRVLRPGGRCVFAVWSTAQTMPTLFWSYHVFKGKLEDDKLPPLSIITSMGEPGAMDRALLAAGWTDFQIEPVRFDYQFPSFEAYWDAVEASDIMKVQFDALSPQMRDQVRDEVAVLANEFVGPNGLQVPHEFLLVTATK